MTAAEESSLPDLVEARAKLRAVIARCKSEAGRLDALTSALDRCQGQQRGVRSQLADVEASLAEARHSERSRKAYGFLNNETGELDLLDTHGAEAERLRAELSRLEDIELAITGEIETVQAGLRQLNSKVLTAKADLVVAAPEFQQLCDQHAACFQRLRSIKTTLRTIAGSLYGRSGQLVLELAELWQPMEERVGYPVDDTPEAWRAALAALEQDAGAQLPNGNDAVHTNGTNGSPPPSANGHGGRAAAK